MTAGLLHFWWWILVFESALVLIAFAIFRKRIHLPAGLWFLLLPAGELFLLIAVRTFFPSYLIYADGLCTAALLIHFLMALYSPASDIETAPEEAVSYETVSEAARPETAVDAVRLSEEIGVFRAFLSEMKETTPGLLELDAFESVRESFPVCMEKITLCAIEIRRNFDKLDVFRRSIHNGAGLIGSVGKDMSGSVEGMVKGMDEGHDRVEGSRNSLDALRVSVENVRNIVDLMNDIADETRMLSINAAIEASHAGESGLGFSVIAREISEVSDDTMAETGRISRETEGILEAAAEQRDQVSALSDLFKDLSANLEKLYIVTVNAITYTSNLAKFIREADKESEYRETLKRFSRSVLEWPKPLVFDAAHLNHFEESVERMERSLARLEEFARRQTPVC